MFILMPLKKDYARTGYEHTFLDGYIKILKKNKIPFSLIGYQNTRSFWDEIFMTKYFIARWKGNDKDLSLMHAILPEIEKKGVISLPSFNTVYHCGDKLRLAAFYQANKIKTPNTYVFRTIDDFHEWFDQNHHKLPLVAKLRQGASSKNVIKLETKKQANRLAQKLFKHGIRDGFMEEAALGRIGSLVKYGIHLSTKNTGAIKSKLNLLLFDKLKHRDSTCLILQDYLPNSYDTRVTVIGDRAFCFRRHNRKNDFRASGSGAIDYEPKAIDERMIEMAFYISRNYSFQTMSYDFLYDQNNQPSLIEMNYTYSDLAVARCPLYWNSCGSTNENLGRFPQYYQLVDLMDDITLKHF